MPQQLIAGFDFNEALLQAQWPHAPRKTARRRQSLTAQVIPTAIQPELGATASGQAPVKEMKPRKTMPKINTPNAAGLVPWVGCFCVRVSDRRLHPKSTSACHPLERHLQQAAGQAGARASEPRRRHGEFRWFKAEAYAIRDFCSGRAFCSVTCRKNCHFSHILIWKAYGTFSAV